MSNIPPPIQLEYSNASLFRPPLVTSIGVISIALGAIGIIGFCASIISGKYMAPGVTITPAPQIPIVTHVIQGLNALLGIYLLILGILTLRDSRRALHRHWVYVWLKIPLAIVSGVETWWTFRVLVRGMQGPKYAWVDSFAIVLAIAGLLMALIYPVGLMFVLRTSKVRVWAGRK